MDFPWLADGVTEDEQRAAYRLREILRQAPTIAETLLGFPWLADGVTEDESWAILQLERIVQEDPTVAKTLLGFPWLADGVTREERNTAYSLREILREDPAIAETILGFPWLADGVTSDESNVVYYLQLILQGDPAAAESLLGSTWLADGVTRGEEQTIRDLSGPYRLDRYGLSALNTKPWFKDGFSKEELTLIGYLISIANRDADAAAALVTMPFLESVEIRDYLALDSLNDIARQDASDFRELMSHPKIKDGITDEDTKIVAVLGGATYEYAPRSAEVLLAETGVYIEERLIELPHTGETLLAIIRVQDKDTPTMDNFEHAVGTIERFMGEPFPINYLALLFYDMQPKGAYDSYTHVLMHPDRDLVDGPYWHAGVIAHEVAHWYWRNNGDRFQYQHWIVEGGADFLRIISQHERVGRPLEPIGRPCRYFDNISELEKANPGRSNPASECENSLGQGLLLDLYFALGDETFRLAYRTLYLRHLQDDQTDGCGGPRLNICRLETAFKDGASAEAVRRVDEVIARWYGPRP